MSIYEITFSPTGGTQKVSRLFAKVFSQKSTIINLADRKQDFSTFYFHDEDICIISVPSYGGRVPEVAVARLKKMTGGNAKAVLIAVYGNRAYDDTLLELYNTLKSVNFRCVAAIAAVAEHSIMHQFAAGRPDAQDKKEIAFFAEKIRDKIETGNFSGNLALPGKKPYQDYGGVPLKPKAGRACTRCGLCATECPVGAIPASNPKETNKKECISCMRCIMICPNKSRHISKLTLFFGAQKMKKTCSEYKRNEFYF